MGQFIVDINHLKEILEKYPKFEHELVLSDLSPTDKMNFRSVEKLMNDNLLKILEKNEEHSATLQYLKIMKYCVQSFLSTTISMRTRIYYMWYSVMFLRIWKKWIPLNGCYVIRDHFISTPTHACIELNAHGLIIAILKYGTNCFPWLMGSQECEKLFRKLRSMSSTFSTVVNMSILDLLYRLKRIQILSSAKENLEDYIFPNEKSDVPASNFNEENISLDEIIKIVTEAKGKAIIDACKLGMYVDADFDECNPVSFKYIQDIHEEPNSSNEETEDENITPQELENEENEEILEELLNIDHEALQSIKSLDVKNYEEIPLIKQKGFVQLKFKEKTYTIRKSTLVWMLTKENVRVSSDRLFRFKT